MKSITRLVLAGLALAVFVTAALSWSFSVWQTRPSPLLRTTTVVLIAPGSGVARIGAQLADSGVIDDAWRFRLLVQLQGAAHRLQAGEYEFQPGVSPRTVLERLLRGDVLLHEVRLIEGWTFAQALRTIRADDAVRTTDSAEREFLALLPAGIESPEGRIFPSTYRFARGTTDLQLLQVAASRLEEELLDAWRERASDLPLREPREALVLASLVEKESGVEDERPLIAGVFVNRLRSGMRLQSDPTVIYGLGSEFDGNLRRADLRRDTPYNTYTRAGLPPTPIALVGSGAIRAATRPATTAAVYFVATGDGDGRHRFAATLAEHNRNVARFLRTRAAAQGDRR